MAGTQWSQKEVAATVDSYFRMLRSELAGRAYSKTDENAALRTQLDGRSKGAVEFKHQNISAILAEQGVRYVNGYKPRKNVQGLLRQEVERRLESDQEFKGSLTT